MIQGQVYSKYGYDGYGSGNAIAGVVLHSMDGNYATGGVNVLLNTQQSWHFSILRDGQVLQHYDLERQCYHTGVGGANRKYIGIEHEGYHEAGPPEPIYEAQIKASVELVQWIANIPVAWPVELNHTLFEHKFFGTSSCPGNRFDGILERWTDTTNEDPNHANNYDVGLERLKLEEMIRIIRDEHARAKGDKQVLHDIIDGRR